MDSGSYKVEEEQVLSAELARLRMQSQQMQALEKKLLQDTGLLPQHKVIELGSGPGFISSLLLEMIPEGELLATEINPQLFKILQETIASNPRAKAALCSVEKIDIEDEWADFVYGRFIFQHLKNPENVLKETYRCCKKGGKVIVVDSDDGLILTHPKTNNLEAFLQKAQEEQKKLNGNRLIGREIQNLLSQAGFEKIRSKVLCFTPSDIPIDPFLRMLFGFKSTLIEDKELVNAAYAELHNALSKGDTFACVGIVVTVGTKPL